MTGVEGADGGCVMGKSVEGVEGGCFFANAISNMFFARK